MYDLNKINDCLNTKDMGRTIIQYDRITSTYLKAKNIMATCPEGTVVLSENQDKWCLRMGREWVCIPDENIYLSIILKPLVNNHLTPIYDAIGCVCVCQALNKLYNLNFKIKWPNDVIINERKISSVASNIISTNNNYGVIITLGVNVNTNKAELEQNEEIKNTATSLRIELNQEVDREALIGEILNNVDYFYNELIYSKGALQLLNIYNQNSLIFNETVEVMKKGKKTKRKVLAKYINQEGHLVVKNENGIEEILSPGETIITYEKQA